MYAWFSALLLASPAAATNIVVPTQFPTVTHALNALSGVGPHTIVITADGVYDEPYTLNSPGDITVIGTGAGRTFLRVTDPAATTAFTTSMGRLVLRDLTLTGSTADPVDVERGVCSPPANQRGVTVSNAALELQDVELVCFASADRGGAIRAVGADLTADGGAFRDNTSQLSGGHLLVQDSNAVITHSTFERGTSSWGGGAIWADGGTLAVSTSTFENNQAPEGGALQVGATGSADVFLSTFTGNTALDPMFRQGRGGAVWSEAVPLDLWGNTFCANASDTGGAVAAQGPDVSATNNVFSSNRATLAGGALALLAGDLGEPYVVNNTFTGNSAGLDENGQLVALGGGGAVFLDGVGATFRNNLVAFQLDGGGLTAVEGAELLPGDPVELAYNAWYANCERAGCDPWASLHLAGLLAGVALDATNVVDDDPQLAYAGVGDQECTSDAPWPVWGSPLLDRGDPDWDYDDVDASRNDIGHTGGPAALVLDRDADGYHGYLDCDDTDSWVHPGGVEVCNLVDDDCDGSIDEGFALLWYPDGDGDGFGDPAGPPVVSCSPPPDTASNNLDCDDGDVARSPVAQEVCDGEDNDCNGVADDPDMVQYVPYYVDNDGDWYGIDASYQALCEDPGPGFTTTPGDCNDAQASVNPSAAEVCDGLDNDCNGLADDYAVDGVQGYPDEDGDGFGTGYWLTDCEPPGDLTLASASGDCDDTDADISPAAAERCNLEDDDCDGVVDEDAADAAAWYQDADGDGLVNPATQVLACNQPPGKVKADPKLDRPFDCDDLDATVGPCRGCGCDSVPTGSGLLGLPALALLALCVRRRGPV